jgi:hypothetical protein
VSTALMFDWEDTTLPIHIQLLVNNLLTLSGYHGCALPAHA